MGTVYRPRALVLVGAIAAASIIQARQATAQVSTERPGSILIFPKVVRTATLDTKIEISNTYSMINHVRCFYIDAQSGTNNEPLCTHTDFELTLTKQQPTQWSAGAGRPVRSDPFGTPGSGLDPGAIPPVPQGFTGTLICAEVGADGLPTGLNKLTGAATVTDASGDQNRYNAVAVPATPDVNKDNTLILGSEYAACPADTQVNFAAVNGEDPILGSNSQQGAVLTLVPCQFDIENGIATNGSATFNVYNELEQTTSGSIRYSCLGNIDLSTLPQATSVSAGGQLSTEFGYMALHANPPVVGVLTTVHSDSNGNVASASRNLHASGTGSTTQIRIAD